MASAQSSIWKDAPELAIPDVPALLCDSSDLWLCYAVARTASGRFAIVRFVDVIDHRLSPINDEGLGEHPYAAAGLRFYAFNEITGSDETIEWSALKARHCAVTFKDNTLDVVARDAKVVARDLRASSPTAALLVFCTMGQANKLLPPRTGVMRFSLVSHYPFLWGLAVLLAFVVISAAAAFLNLAIFPPIFRLLGRSTGKQRVTNSEPRDDHAA